MPRGPPARRAWARTSSEFGGGDVSLGGVELERPVQEMALALSWGIYSEVTIKNLFNDNVGRSN